MNSDDLSKKLDALIAHRDWWEHPWFVRGAVGVGAVAVIGVGLPVALEANSRQAAQRVEAQNDAQNLADAERNLALLEAGDRIAREYLKVGRFLYASNDMTKAVYLSPDTEPYDYSTIPPRPIAEGVVIIDPNGCGGVINHVFNEAGEFVRPEVQGIVCTKWEEGEWDKWMRQQFGSQYAGVYTNPSDLVAPPIGGGVQP